jgi:hypothetical protein
VKLTVWSGVHVGVEPFTAPDGTTGKALVIRDDREQVVLQLDADGCREIAGLLTGGIQVATPADLESIGGTE